MKIRSLTYITFLLSGLLLGNAKENILWYTAPAREWTEALPLGNSRIGAMIFSDPAQERIQLNEETMWGGGPHTNHSIKAKEELENVRQLIFSGKNQEAQDLIGKTFLTGKKSLTYNVLCL